MANKTLKIRRVLAWAIYDNLRKMPPRIYPTTAEIKSTLNEVMPKLKPAGDSYNDILSRADETKDQIATEQITKEEGAKKIDELNKEWQDYNRKSGSEIIEIEFTAEGFKTLKEQFERDGKEWGKQWVANISEYAEVLEALSETGKEEDKEKKEEKAE